MTNEEFKLLLKRKGYDSEPENVIRLDDGFITFTPFTDGGKEYLYVVVGSITEKYSLGLVKRLVKEVRKQKLPTVTNVDGNYDEMGAFIKRLGAVEVKPNIYLIR